MFIVSRIDYHVWQKLSLPVYGLALLLCVAVLFLGSDSNGSSRWFRIGGLSVQPSEIAKIAVIIFTAALLCKTAKQIAKLQNLIKVFCFIAPIVLVIAVNNLSTAIIVAGIAFIMVFVVSPKYTHFIAFAAVAAVAVVGFILVQGYRADRIQPGSIRKIIRIPPIRLSRDFTPSVPAACSARDWEPVCRSWDMCRKPRTI